ncbi:MAG: sialate O-acetylesterase [Clostridia bacterium]|nr:sialate O-acetylesterase [Clostridia bacterium]
MMHSFLLIGQSNMAGRGEIEKAMPIDNSRIYVLRNGRWQKMFRPVNPDRAFAGVNLAESFAEIYAKEHNVDVGLIPCADGGTCLNQWRVGGLLYDNAVYQTRLAERTSNVVGILWHQGEADSTVEFKKDYEPKFTEIINSLRKDLNLTDVPVIVGGLGDFLKDYEGSVKFPDEVNLALQTVAKNNKLIGFASAEGLKSKGDNLHFDSESLYEFGLRYYKEFIKLYDKDKVYPEKSSPDDAVRSEMENL